MGGCIALVVAAGSGVRFGSETPKQYLPLDGLPMVRHSVETFLGHPQVDAVRVVIQPDHRAFYETAMAGLDLPPPIDGGATRQESARRGLEALAGEAPEIVLIHDAARPFVDAATIARVIEAARATGAAIAAVPVHDTLKRAAETEAGTPAQIAGTVNRDGLWRAQTPQGFRYADILAAHRRFAEAVSTDDAALAERAGLAVALVPGSEDNMKITTSEDLSRQNAERSGETRVGTGFDVHRFGPGEAVILCGVRVPHGAGLAGHSDADVGLHALTDALLGALGDGDIGSHFPPGDPQWRGTASDLFLRDAARRVEDRGGRIINVDVTLICETPKIGPHREAMRARIAEILGLAPDRVSVKATTTEKLGFTGRGEGIAAQATATIHLPTSGRE